MDFAFNEEQQMLAASARRFFAERFPLERVAELSDRGDVFDAGSWREVAELGWIGLSVPDEAGGAGMGFLEEAVLFEQMGYALYPGPYFSTVALALPALASARRALAEVVAGEAAVTLAYAEPSGPDGLAELDRLGTKAEPSDGRWRLTGEKHLVPDASTARYAVVTASAAEGPGLWLVELNRAERRELSTMDPTRPLAAVTFAGVEARLLVAPQEAESVVSAIRRRALAAAALEAVGVAQRALDLAVEYAKQRRQFDKPIGTYQAVSHPLADTYVQTELARSLAYWAAWSVAEGDEAAEVAVAGAKAAAGEAAVTACERSIQVHGGIGFTWEHPLHRFYKRAHWLDSFQGSGARHRSEIAAALLD